MKGQRLFPAALCLLLAGCTTVLPVINQSKFFDRLAQVEQISQELDVPRAMRQYQDYIATERTSFDLPLADYQKKLQDQILVVIRRGLPSVAGEGIPHLYDARFSALIQAYRGLASMQIKQRDFAGAQKTLFEANFLVRSRSISPVNLSQDLSENYSLLKSIYESQGKAGKILLADLNINLSQDYLGSPQGRKTARAVKQALQKSQGIVVNVDFLIGDANARAKAEAIRRLNETMEAVNMALDPYAIKGNMPKGRSQAEQINDVVLQTAQAYVGDASGKTALNPLGSVVTIRQLVDPGSSINPQGIIKNFCAAAAGLRGDAQIEQGTQDVSSLMDGVMAAREKGKPEQIAAAIQDFGKAFTSLQGLVEKADK